MKIQINRLAVLLLSASCLFLPGMSFAAAGAPPAPGGPPSEKTPSIAERTAGLPKHDGFIPYWWDARKGVLLLEIERWDEKFLYGAGLASGVGVIEAFLDRGQPGNLGLCRFERVGPRVLLVEEQTTNRSGTPDPERTRVVEESFPTSIVASLPIVAEDDVRVVVDATDFLLRDTQVLPSLRQSHLGDWRQDSSRSSFHFGRTGAFPKNTEIEVQLTFSSDLPPPAVEEVLPDGHTMTLRVHHSFVRLPEDGYTPRPLDPRIGFIPMFYRDQTAPVEQPIERYLATRWRLDAAHPIVYYLDRGIPEPERAAAREAALWWNHAFAESGFPGALRIEDLPVGASFLDVRYSGVEWVNRAERGWSVGEIQVDPRTGEILHGVARIDSHRRRTTAAIWRNLQPPPLPRLSGGCEAGDAPDFSWLASDAGAEGGVGERDLVLERLRYLVAHEVGHTLGLMHNWAATTFGWGSVMDYLAPNIQLKNGRLDLSDAYPSDIGSYDRLMIRWGYSAGEDREKLDAIVREGYGKGIFYPLESDPRWAEYDWGSDPVEWLATTQQVRQVILSRFGVGQLSAGERVYDLQSRFSFAYLYHRFAIRTAQQFVGGQFQANALAGDGQKPVAWVPPGQQRKALRLLLAALSPENLDIPDAALSSLVAPPQGERATRERFPSEAGETFSALTAARTLAGLIVAPLLDPARAARLILDDETGAPRFEEVLRDLEAASWGATPERSERFARLRRVAKGAVVESVLDLAGNATAAPEVRAAAWAEVGRLRRLAAAKADAAPTEEEEFRALIRREIDEFIAKPETRKDRPAAPPAPPGRPIGAGKTD
jgi:hypothetical protein